MAAFWVADLTATGEARSIQEYQYPILEQLEGAVELIGAFSSALWQSPDGFEIPLPGGRLQMRWLACSDSAGIATLRDGQNLASLSILLCGREQSADQSVLQPIQLHLVRELHDTGYEAAFDLVHLKERPLLASVHFRAPDHTGDHRTFALADRCFAASYFRKMGLA